MDLSPSPAGGEAALALDPTGGPLASAAGALGPSGLAFPGKVPEPFALSGVGHVHVKGTLDGAANGYLAAALYEDAPDGAHLITWGQVNLAHDANHTTYTPIEPGDVVATDLPLQPTEHLFAAGSTLRLVLRGVVPNDGTRVTDPYGVAGARFTFHSGPDGTHLVLPTLPLSEYKPIPPTATP